MAAGEIRNERVPLWALSLLLAVLASACGACQFTQNDVGSVKANPSNLHAVAVPGKPGLSFRWSGANFVFFDVLSSQKSQLARVGCGPKAPCSHDLKPGKYYVKVGVPGYEEPLPITVTGSATTEIGPPVGTAAMRWNGANFVFVDVLDRSQKTQLARLGCGSKAACSQDLIPGDYYLKVALPGYEQPLPITVKDSATSEVAPPAGTAAVRWNGANFVFVDVLDSSQKTQLARLGCGSKGTCSQDVTPGNYYVKVGVPGYDEPLPITVADSATSEVAPPIGTAAVRWNGADYTFVDVLNAQKIQLARVGCESKGTCSQDLKPGNYYVKPQTAGFDQPVAVTITAGRTSELSLGPK